ncbi:hypothetical protein [Streptomyces sp. AJS327]|uniref:hypothetical protein n=1 Tax=Streptomyces sp. AJS327 TaxID=2545265 RepID=UPI0015DF569D|nr:hypothetical protein [Streptomyces sp. AJS327]
MIPEMETGTNVKASRDGLLTLAGAAVLTVVATSAKSRLPLRLAARHFTNQQARKQFSA